MLDEPPDRGTPELEDLQDWVPLHAPRPDSNLEDNLLALQDPENAPPEPHEQQGIA